MKNIYFILILIFAFSFGHSQKPNELEQICTILLENFSENKLFVTADYEHHFHQPEVEIIGDTLHMAYIKETKEKDTKEVYFEKIEHIFPVECLIESYTFEFHFGQADWAYPGIWYRYFDIAQTCSGVVTKIYDLDPADWNKKTSDGSEDMNGSRLEWDHIWFPTSKKAEKKLDRLFRKIIKQSKSE